MERSYQAIHQPEITRSKATPLTPTPSLPDSELFALLQLPRPLLKPFPSLSNSCHLCPTTSLGQSLPVPGCPFQDGLRRQIRGCRSKYPLPQDKPSCYRKSSAPPSRPRPSPAAGSLWVVRPSCPSSLGSEGPGARGVGSETPASDPAQAPPPEGGRVVVVVQLTLHFT